MERKAARKNTRNGFTAIETVVTVIVLAILAAYATPKLFGLKDRADATEETFKIKDIEARHSQETLKAGKRGVNPTLGDVVGFRPEAAAEPAPDTAPVLADWRFQTLSPSPHTLNKTGLLDVPFFDTYDLEPVYLTRQDMLTAGQDLLCDRSPSLFNSKYAAGFYIHGSAPARYGVSFEDSDFSMVRSGKAEDVPITENAPKCSLSIKFRVFRENTTGSLFGPPWNMRGVLYEYDYRPTTKQLETSIFPDGSSTPGTIYNQAWLGSNTSTTNYQSTPTANVFRLDCSAHSARYGAPYIVKNSSWTSGGSLNGAETSGWRTLAVNALPAASVVQTSSSPIMKDITINLASHWPSINWGVCERQGPAPDLPPSDPGDPGAYPMASDGSGYCLSPGRKLPTYRDGSGTPTSSSSDPVAELGTEAVDDIANCPE